MKTGNATQNMKRKRQKGWPLEEHREVQEKFMLLLVKNDLHIFKCLMKGTNKKDIDERR